MSAPRFSVLDPGGPQAGKIASLWDLFYWVSVAVFAIVAVTFVVASVRAIWLRRRLGERDPLVDDPVHERRLVGGVIAAGAVTVVALIALLVASIRSGSALAALEDDADALHIKITAHQWWWQVEYEPDDPARFASTANEIHVPVGRTVHLEL